MAVWFGLGVLRIGAWLSFGLCSRFSLLLASTWQTGERAVIKADETARQFTTTEGEKEKNYHVGRFL